MTSTMKSVRVADDQAGGRLDRVLATHIAELSRTRLKALIEAGAVAVDGRTIRDPGHRVNSGAAVQIDIPPPAAAKPAPEPIPLNVVYEDADIIVIDKPKNLVVHPAAGNWTGTLVNALIAHCGESLSGIGGERRPGIVHRLDKDTTGLMVVAKSDRAHRALAAQFADHGRSGEPFERAYLAFVWGAPDRPRGTIDRPIDRHPQARDRMAVRAGRARGDNPLGSARTLRHGGRASRGGREKHAATRASRQPAPVPPRNRPHPPDSGAFGLDRASLAGRRGLRDGFSHQERAFAAASPGRAQGPWQTGPPCPYPISQASHRALKSFGSDRNCRPISPVCVGSWRPCRLIPARK